ncbi:hypothetical protein [Nocardia wallacei]|uniref:hypothetical protein n=1 Tax=Nocardia wallacei TaxID=480035 RepID=UPI00245584A9|nr:hypothetical protein [Nocardia wallacei]
MKTADEIRALYIETLARTQRAEDLAHYPQREDGTPREDWAAMSERMRRMYLDAAAPFVDALAEAGLLVIAEETATEWSFNGREKSREIVTRRRYVTAWRAE